MQTGVIVFHRFFVGSKHLAACRDQIILKKKNMTKIARLANAASPGGRKKKDNKHTHRSGSSTAKSLQLAPVFAANFWGLVDSKGHP